MQKGALLVPRYLQVLVAMTLFGGATACGDSGSSGGADAGASGLDGSGGLGASSGGGRGGTSSGGAQSGGAQSGGRTSTGGAQAGGASGQSGTGSGPAGGAAPMGGSGGFPGNGGTIAVGGAGATGGTPSGGNPSGGFGGASGDGGASGGDTSTGGSSAGTSGNSGTTGASGNAGTSGNAGAGGVGVGGAGGAGPECDTPDECPESASPCATPICDDGSCGLNNLDPGTSIPEQTAGDCRQLVCDGTGNVRNEVANGDVPDDGDPCTTESCVEGSPEEGLAAPGTPCNGGVCDGSGACVECTADADCPSGMCYEESCVASVNGCDVDTALDRTGLTAVTVTFPNGNTTYDPKCLKVSSGTQVTFSGSFSAHPLQGGVDGAPASSGPFVPATNSGASRTFTLNTPGTFPYYCIPHNQLGMNGAVFVVP